MISLDENQLLTQYRESKDLQIENLLDQYGSSLKEVRAMYPQLTESIKQRQLTTAFPTQPLFFTPSEAQNMGLSLQEGWMLKMTPTEGGYTSSFITPEKWEITEGGQYISPTGEQYSQADIQALLTTPVEGLTQEATQPLTIENLTEEGQRLYEEYQQAGGALDVAGWYQEQQSEQLQTEQVFGKVFPEQDIEEVLNYIDTDPEGFLADIREIGWTADTEALLQEMARLSESPPFTQEDLQNIFGTTTRYIPESALKDFKDALLVDAVGTIQNIETFLFTQPVTKPTRETLEAWATRTTAFDPQLMQNPALYKQYVEPIAQARYEEAVQQTGEAYIRRRQQQQQYWIDHPELAPNPEYLKNPFKDPSLFLTPGYWAYSIGSSLAYSLAVMGTIVAVSAIATPFVGIPAGVLVAAMPEAGNMLDQLISMGVPVAEARQKALLGGLIAGGVEAISDIPFIGLVFKPLKPAIQPLLNTIKKVTTNAIAKAVITGLTIPQIEGLEEVITQLAQNAILKHYDETQSLLQGVSQAYIQAVIASLPFGVIGGGASYRTFRNNLSLETGKQLDDLVNKFQDKGLTEQQAQVQAANELAKTPEGEAELSKAIEAAQNEYYEEHPEVTRPSLEPTIPNLPESILQDIKVAEEIAKGVPVTGVEAGILRYEKGVLNVVIDLNPDLQGVRTLLDINRIYRLSKVSGEDTYRVLDANNDPLGFISGNNARGLADLGYEPFKSSLEAINKANEVTTPKAEAGMPEVTPELTKKVEQVIRNLHRRKYNKIVDIDYANAAFDLFDEKQFARDLGIRPADIEKVIEFKRAEPTFTGAKGLIFTPTEADIRNAIPKIAQMIESYKSEAIPETPSGMPEAGLQPSMLEEVPAKEVRPEATGRLVQARLDDYLRLRDYNKQATIDRIAEIKKALETKGRSALGLKGTLKLELARLEALQQLDAVEGIGDLDSLIREVENELGLRSMPGRGQPARSGIAKARHPRVPNIFPEYTSRQLEEMRNVYLQAREKLQPTTSVVKAQDVPMDMPAVQSMTLTPAQVEKTVDLFKQAIIAPNAEMQRAATIELRKHVLAQRAKAAHESAQAMITEGANPEEAIKAAEQMFMSGKLPDMTIDYFSDLTQEMRNVLFAKVYNYWKDKSWFELISTFDALTNALAGKSIPRVKGVGTKYFPGGGSAWDRLARVFVGDMEVLNALDQGKSLRDVIQGVLLESGRGEVSLSQETVDWLKELSTISEEDKLLLTKPLSELTEGDVRRIATKWFWNRQNELNTLLAAGTITRSEYQLELMIAKDRVFPHKPMAPVATYPSGVVGQPRLAEAYTPIEGLPETRTAEELRLAKFELEKKQREATTEPVVTPPPSEWAVYNEAFKEMPLLTLREKETIIRTLKTLGLGAIDIGNFIRANKASCDMSAWRQVMTLTPGNPVAAYRSEVEAWKALFSQASAEANWEWVKRQPSFPYYAEMAQRTGQDFLRVFKVPKGTAQWQAAEEFGYLTGERRISRFTAKVPWIKWSGRAFTTKVNTMTIMVYNKCLEATLARADMIATGKIKLPEGEGFSIQQDMDDYGKAIAWMTQRASLGKAKALAPEISAMVFAPRSWLGRFLTPKLLIDSNPRVRTFAWKNLSLDVGVIGGLVMLGYFLDLWDYEDDPRSGEFGSIRIGNLRIDPWAGFRQFFVLYTRLITGTGVYSVTGQEYEVNPIGALTSFFRNALSPLAATLLDFWTGKTFGGEKVDITNPMQWVDRIAPFTVQTILEAYQDSWQHGLIAFLPAFFGAGVSAYTGDWAQNWLRIGLPKYPENTGYGILEPIYDLQDFWADTASQLRGVDPATLTASKGFPEYVRSIATALQIIDQLDTLPNKKLTLFNADPEKGTTFMQYYQMWQDRQRIVASGDTEKLKAFDADERTRNAYLGNITQAQYALLVEYNSLPEDQKAEFLGKHPELYINPREEWLRTHPQENALLVLWGKADPYSTEAVNKVSTLVKSLGIPENALVMKDLDAVSELKLKNQHLLDLLEAYGGLDDTLKGPDSLTARDRAVQQLYVDNPDFRNDERRIEALNVGTKDNPTLDTMVEGWVERGQVADEFGPSSAEMKLWLIDNKEVHQWALENALLTDTGEDWNENILRLQVNYKEDFDLYDAYGNEKSPSYIANDTARTDAREAMLFSKDKMTSFGVAYYTINALQKNLPENLVNTYVDYYGIRKKASVDYSAGWYEDDWFLIENKNFYNTMVSMGIWQSRDFSKVPTRQVYSLYQHYLALPTEDPRKKFRIQCPELDAWLVYAKEYSFSSDAARDIFSNHPEQFLAYR